MSVSSRLCKYEMLCCEGWGRRSVTTFVTLFIWHSSPDTLDTDTSPDYCTYLHISTHIYTYLQISISSRIVKVAGHCDVVGGMEVDRSRTAKYFHFLWPFIFQNQWDDGAPCPYILTISSISSPTLDKKAAEQKVAPGWPQLARHLPMSV